MEQRTMMSGSRYTPSLHFVSFWLLCYPKLLTLTKHQRSVHNPTRLAQNLLQVFLAFIGLGVNLVDVPRARAPSRNRPLGRRRA